MIFFLYKLPNFNNTHCSKQLNLSKKYHKYFLEKEFHFDIFVVSVDKKWSAQLDFFVKSLGSSIQCYSGGQPLRSELFVVISVGKFERLILIFTVIVKSKYKF
jgi:hypothetical protein